MRFVILMLASAAMLPAEPVKYELDPAHSSASFSVRHLMVSNVRGEFARLSGSVVYDPDNLAACRVEVIDAGSINTREPKRDAHLKSADFLDVANHPQIKFAGKRFYRESGSLKVLGELTIRGVTKEVVLAVDGPTPEVKDPWGNRRIGATATATINRTDWGLTWNRALEAGGVVVGEQVAITIDLEAVKK